MPTCTTISARFSAAVLCGVILGAGATFGCGAPEEGFTPVRWHDQAQFEIQVLPILGERCANPSCHGRPERPLSLFFPRRYREDSSRTFLDEPLTPGELSHNYSVSCALSSEASTPEETPFLAKPRGIRAGVYHGGGEVFNDTTEREYRVLLAWVRTGWK